MTTKKRATNARHGEPPPNRHRRQSRDELSYMIQSISSSTPPDFPLNFLGVIKLGAFFSFIALLRVCGVEEFVLSQIGLLSFDILLRPRVPSSGNLFHFLSHDSLCCAREVYIGGILLLSCLLWPGRTEGRRKLEKWYHWGMILLEVHDWWIFSLIFSTKFFDYSSDSILKFSSASGSSHLVFTLIKLCCDCHFARWNMLLKPIQSGMSELVEGERKETT